MNERAVALSQRSSGTDEPRVPPVSSERVPGYAWYVTGLMGLVVAINYLDRTALSALMPLIKADLDLSDSELGLLVGFAFFLFYAVCGIPIARLADRTNRRNLLAIALSVWSLMTALSGAAQNFWHLLLARVGLGAGEAGCIPSSNSLVADYIPVNRRPIAFTILSIGSSAGIALGLIVVGALGEAIGWRWTFVALGLPGLGLAVLVRLTVRELPRGILDRHTPDVTRLSFREAIAHLFRRRTFRLFVAYYVFNGFTTIGLLSWWPSFFSRAFTENLSVVGLSLGLAVGIGSGIGTLVGGIVAHRAVKRNAKRPLLIGVVCILLALPATLASLFAPTPMISTGLVLLAVLLWSVPHGPVSASFITSNPPHLRATATALVTFFISILGFGLGPFCVGALSDALTPVWGIESLRYALLLPIGFLLLLATSLHLTANALYPNASVVPAPARVG